MAIRLRTVNGVRVALCAVESDPKPGDIYLDDADHHALSTKFGLDWQDMGFIEDPPIDKVVAAAMETQKVRDAREEMEKWCADRDAKRCNCGMGDASLPALHSDWCTSLPGCTCPPNDGHSELCPIHRRNSVPR